MDLIPKLKYGIIKSFGTGRFMKLKNDMAKNQRTYYQLNKNEIDELQDFIKSLDENTSEDNEEVRTYLIKMRDIQVKQMEFMLVPAIVDELCELVAKIGNQCTINEIDIDDLSLNDMVSLGYQIVRLDDPKDEEEAAEKKKIIA